MTAPSLCRSRRRAPMTTVLACLVSVGWLSASSSAQEPNFAVVAGGVQTDDTNDVTSIPDGTGDFAVCGYFHVQLVLGPGEVADANHAGETILTEWGGGSAFAARYGPDGRLRWAVQMGVEPGAILGRDNATGIAALSDGSVIVAGRVVGAKSQLAVFTSTNEVGDSFSLDLTSQMFVAR